MQKGYSFKDLVYQIKKHKKNFIIATLVAILAVAVSTPAPLLMPLLVDEVLLKKPGILTATIDQIFGKSEPYFYVLVVLLITIFLRALFFLLNVYQTKIFKVISKDITFNIRKDALKHIQKTALSEFETFGSANISSRLIVDIDTIDKFLGVSVSRLIVSVLTVIGVAIVLLMIHWKLALFILFLNPFVIFLTTKIARRVGKLKKKENLTFEIFTEALNETLDLFRQIKAANQEKNFIQRVIEEAKKIKKASIEFEYKSDAATKFSFLVFLAGFEIFRAAGILMVAYSNLSIGLMLAVFGYLWVMMNPIQEILNIQYAYHSAKAALKRVNDIFKLKQEPSYPHLKNPFKNSKTNSIELQNVYFAYENGDYVLKNISMKIEKGSKVAIIGASGSGKTTLAQIMVGFYPIEKGELFYDKINVKEIGLDVVREHVYLVLQNPQLLNATIRENLTFGKKVDENKIEKALKIAQLYDFIKGLKNGLDTHIGKDGIKLSGGQRQRLSIARMILAEPNVVILDESTSALDIYTEESLFEALLSEFLKERTTIIIAHRLTTIRQADYIYVLDKGQIIEEGTQEFLMKKEGVFFEFLSKGRG